MYILLAIFIFGFLVFIHELGHYITARIFNVHVIEFALGMGPKLFSWTSKKTGIVYSWRLLPIGGFVSMAGEDGESDDERALQKKPVWQRIIIISAGAVMNILLGIILSFVMVVSSPAIGSNVVAQFDENAASDDYGLMVGDKICSINGAQTAISTQVVYEIGRCTNGPVDIKILRDGSELVIKDVVFGQTTDSGIVFGVCDFKISAEEKNVPNILKHTWHTSVLSAKMVWQSLIDLISGKYTMEAVSGPVGITGTMTEVAKESTVSLIYLSSIIAINLGICNLLPIPALDGGRLVFQFIELIFRRPVNRKIEAYIHTAGIVVLLFFMLLITFKDVVNLF